MTDSLGGEHGDWDIAPGESRACWQLKRVIDALEVARRATAAARAEAAVSADEALTERLAAIEAELRARTGDVAKILQARGGERDLVEEASMESFPASDPPGYQP